MKNSKKLSVYTFVFMVVGFMALPMSSAFAGQFMSKSMTGIVSIDSCGTYQADEKKDAEKEEEPDCE